MQDGITLVALVITVVVILILASITIVFTINKIESANRANAAYDKAKADEDIDLAVFSSKINVERKIDKKLLKESLNNLGITENEISDQGDKWIVSYKGYEYTIIISETNSIAVNVALYDYINERDLGTVEVKLLQDAELNDENVSIPSGYKLYSKRNSSIENPKVTIKDGVADKDIYILNLYKESLEGEILIEEIVGLKKIELNLSEKYALNNNIELSSESIWNPIGSKEDGSITAFSGEFNGNGHNISNINCNYANGKSGVGFIAANAGTIENLNLKSAVISGSSNVGAICGSNLENGNISNCHIEGTVTSNSTNTSSGGAGGGITGNNSGTITNCSSKASIKGYLWTGGLVGKNFGTINSSYFIGDVNKTLTSSQISNNTSLNRYIGGITGGNTGTINNSYAILTGYIKGYAGIGGIAGWNKGGTLYNLYVANTQMIYGVNYVSTDVGYVAEMPNYSGLYTWQTTSTEITSIPSQFENKYWNMQGSTYTSCPNLINNSR